MLYGTQLPTPSIILSVQVSSLDMFETMIRKSGICSLMQRCSLSSLTASLAESISHARLNLASCTVLAAYVMGNKLLDKLNEHSVTEQGPPRRSQRAVRAQAGPQTGWQASRRD